MKIHDFNYKTIWQMICILFLVGIGIYSHCHSPKKINNNYTQKK
jgi:hypothetical protein